MSEIKLGDRISGIFNFLGQLLVVLTVLLYAFVFIVGILASLGITFVPANIHPYLAIATAYAPLLIVGVFGLKIFAKRGIILFFLYLLILAFIIVCMFFPSLISLIPGVVVPKLF